MGQENMEPNAGFQLQLGAVKELGFPKLRTLQDFENAIKTYYTNHPTLYDQKSLPLSLLADDWRFLITVSNPANFATGNSDDGEWYVDINTLDAVRHLTREPVKEYFRWLNHMNDVVCWIRKALCRIMTNTKQNRFRPCNRSGRRKMGN